MIKNTMRALLLGLFALCAASSTNSLHAEIKNPVLQKCTKEEKCLIANKIKCFIKNIYPYVGLAAYCLWAKPYLKNEKNFKMFSNDEYNTATKEFINTIAKTFWLVFLCDKIKNHVKYVDAKFTETTGLNDDAACAA